MKRFKYYKTEDGLYFCDNLNKKLYLIIEFGLIKYKKHTNIDSNILFEDLKRFEQDKVLELIDHQDIYTIGDETNENFICDVFESDFEKLLDFEIIRCVICDDDLKGNKTNYIVYSNVFKENVLQHNINHFLNS